MSAILRAIRQTNLSDSITHGPRINAGRFPPMVTLPILRGFTLTSIVGRLCQPPTIFERVSQNGAAGTRATWTGEPARVSFWEKANQTPYNFLRTRSTTAKGA